MEPTQRAAMRLDALGLFLAWLGAAEWTISAVATALLIVTPGLATGPLLLGFALYAPWVWASGL